MPTRRGWEVAVASAAIIGLGRVLGLVGLYAIGTAGILLTLVTLAWVRLHRFDLDAARRVRPARVHVGDTARIELVVHNRASRRSPLLMASDPFEDGRRVARFLLAALSPGERGQAAYRLPTGQRGVHRLGPLHLELRDPFGLASSSTRAAGVTRLTVLPKVEAVLPPPAGLGGEPHAGVDHPSFRGQRGEDFYALRPYAVGDDLRRVHWPSTARLGELMIRQDELPWQDRATVVLDLRRAVHSPASLELAVSAAASVVSAGAIPRSLVRLVDTGGTDTGYGTGAPHAERILDHLADVAGGRSRDLGPTLGRLRSGQGGGTLVAITTGAASESDLEALTRLRPRFAPLLLVVIEPSAVEAAGWAAGPVEDDERDYGGSYG
ncbi:MAG: DUF58 domain-containing protein, partial [Acidimicrobiales bacterium]